MIKIVVFLTLIALSLAIVCLDGFSALYKTEKYVNWLFQALLYISVASLFYIAFEAL